MTNCHAPVFSRPLLRPPALQPHRCVFAASIPNPVFSLLLCSKLSAALQRIVRLFLFLPFAPRSSCRTSRAWFSNQSLDYAHRGPVFSSWPWYFYVAGVQRIQTQTHATAAFLFMPGHPQRETHAQIVRTKTPWRVPLLVGPAIPSQHQDPERRAAILLLLFRPWTDSPRSIRNSFVPDTPPYPSCGAALEAFMLHLRQVDSLQPPQSRPDTYTPTYWARRTLHLIQNIDNWSYRGPWSINAGVRTNPDAAAGIPNTTELRSNYHPTGWEEGLDSDTSADISGDDLVPLQPDTAAQPDRQRNLVHSDILSFLHHHIRAPTTTSGQPLPDHARLMATLDLHFAAPPAPHAPRPQAPVLHLPPRARQDLQQRAHAWDALLAAVSDGDVAPQHPQPPRPLSMPYRPRSILDMAWRNVSSGSCNTRGGELNLKQAAYHLLFAFRLIACDRFQFLGLYFASLLRVLPFFKPYF